SLDPTFTIPQFSLGAFPVDFGKIASFILPWDDGKLIVSGQFQYVNGLPRSSICMIDSTGALLDAFEDCGTGPFTWSNYIYSSIGFMVRDTVNDYLYVCGAYAGYSDGTTNDTLQRFVTRLFVGDITTGVATRTEDPLFTLYPNPTSGSVTLTLEQVPKSATLVVRDALGCVMQRHRLSDHYTTLTLANSGVYVVELWSNGECVAAQRVVVE
ncbi:MAG TPA: T9SS type A sorting domain-containing protein, partial [Flavobacteriales bacterium]|nr:T9SS type A sorting domain-containing protein [Flavobacteriales bacterium]